MPSTSKTGTVIYLTIYHRSLYQRRVRLFKHEQYHIRTAELYHPFDGKLYIREACHKHFYENEIPSRVVCNQMALDTIT